MQTEALRDQEPQRAAIEKMISDEKGRKGDKQRALLKLASSADSFSSEQMLEATMLLF